MLVRFLKLGMIYIHKSFGNLVVTGHQYIFTRYNKMMLWKKRMCYKNNNVEYVSALFFWIVTKNISMNCSS